MDLLATLGPRGLRDRLAHEAREVPWGPRGSKGLKEFKDRPDRWVHPDRKGLLGDTMKNEVYIRYPQP